MRAPSRRRKIKREVSCPEGLDLKSLAKQVKYIGSPEHKDIPSFAGQPRPRADASICDRSLAGEQLKITRWLRKAVRNGTVGGAWEGDFPRYVWHRVDNVVYEARLVNRGTGEYKGYPLNKDEYPKGL